MQISPLYWVGFFVFVAIMLFLDLKVFNREDKTPTIKGSLITSGFWIVLALLFSFVIFHLGGKTPTIDYLTTYTLELSLSLDNLFVFILVFTYFHIDQKYQHRVLFWGVFSAIILRVLFILGGAAILSRFQWLMYVLGAFLLYAGIKMFFEKSNQNDNLDDSRLMQFLNKILPIETTDEGPKFFIKDHGKWYVTQFMVALIFIELSDIIFAFDSIPASLAVTQNTFVVITSNIFALMGLRSFYAALSIILPMFKYIKYGLASILAFIGLKMIINEIAKTVGWHFEISNAASLGFIVLALGIAIIASLISNRRKKQA
ncbi:tellurite resistance protein TerC [Weissella uvarum]|uniref:TerC/Alx family metal homeostasis membrane protein n=1 Tax=Weissella uvarum TaxID=1479233 RepID=UPI001960B548|nr:TerC/Alx family metal homeostasis membrane protein [Weissella uvarum]MBM7616989.1 tellurite resistance protein TerC [Weissella uvarum]MCM0595289.1 TerC/Alx family metal homeostasis membrane protein [Weissella uvarum]